MELVILSIAHLAHMLATVIWIGGIILFLLVILPAAGMALGKGPEMGKFMGAFAAKFKPWAYTAMLLFLVTGILMMLLPETYVEANESESMVPWLLRIKIIIVTVMVFIGLYMGEVNAKKIGKLMAGGGGSEGPPPELAKCQALQMKLLKTNFSLSLMVLILSAIISAM